MKFKSIYEIPMRVTFYARVSSEKDEQLNSLDNQITYYTDLIKKIPTGIMCRGTLTRVYRAYPLKSVKTLIR